jgi:hypothetical protein
MNSKTPPHYRCQPETNFTQSIQTRTHELSLRDNLKTLSADKKLLLVKLQPRFINRQYLTLGYAQLSTECS